MFVKLSIIIVNYNSKKVLRDSLNSIKGCNFPFNYEVFIIDNCSTEKINDLELEYRNYTFIYNDKNIGFAAANNIGIHLAKGKYILLLNPDTIVNTGSFQPLIDYLESHEDVGVVGPKIFNAAGDIERSTHSFPSLIKEFFHANEFFKSFLGYNNRLIGLLKNFMGIKSLESYWDHNSLREVDHVTGACMMVKREVIEKIGLLDEAFFLYNEEVEWSLRIKKGGYKSLFVPDSSIIHLFGHSTKQKVQKQTVNNLLVERYRGMFYFFQKHYGQFRLFLLRVVVFQGFILRLFFKYIRIIFYPLEKKEIFYLRQILKLTFNNNFDWRKN